MEKELSAHKKSISTISYEKEEQKRFYKTRKEKEIEKVISLENQVKVLNDIVYKTRQSIQTMIMLNHNCKTSFSKPQYLKKAQSVIPRIYDIGCYNDNLAVMLASESDETIRTLCNIPISPEMKNVIEQKINPTVEDLATDMDEFYRFLKEEMVEDLKYFNSLEKETESLKSQLELQRTQFSNEINRLSREYYYADHMNAILGVYTKLDEVTNLQCDYLEALEKCQNLKNELSKRNTKSNNFLALEQHVINLKLALQQCQEQINNDKVWK
ncbi:hypothetical protein Tco_0996277 [Tanacetum coccineum]